MRQTELTLVWNCTLKILSVLLERHSNVSRTAWDWKLLWFKYIKNIPKEDALSGRASKPERQPQQPGPKEGTLNGLVPAGLKGSLTSAFKIALYPFILFCSHWAATVEHRNIQAALGEKRLENNEPWEQFYLHHFPYGCYDQNMNLLRTQIPSNQAMKGPHSWGTGAQGWSPELSWLPPGHSQLHALGNVQHHTDMATKFLAVRSHLQFAKGMVTWKFVGGEEPHSGGTHSPLAQPGYPLAHPVRRITSTSHHQSNSPVCAPCLQPSAF